MKQYNIFTAMSTNAASIGLSMESLRHDIPSPFNTDLPWSMNLPPILRPTDQQKQRAHHPWIDLFPVPSVRDALLRHNGKYDDEELCHDLFGSCGDDERGVGLLIWGEAWDPSAYEISEKVARKWLWLLHDCYDVIHSSNHWRKKEAGPVPSPRTVTVDLGRFVRVFCDPIYCAMKPTIGAGWSRVSQPPF